MDAPPARICIRDFRANLTTVLCQVRSGATVLLTSHDEVVAELHPPATLNRPPRQPGALRGEIHMDADFDTLPADVLDVIKGA